MAGGQKARLANASPWGDSRAGRCLPRVRLRHVRRTHRDRVYAGARPPGMVNIRQEGIAIQDRITRRAIVSWQATILRRHPKTRE